MKEKRLGTKNKEKTEGENLEMQQGMLGSMK